MLFYFQESTQLETLMDVHQCERFCNNMRLVHERDIKRITEYLVSSSAYVYLLYGNWRLTTLGVGYRPDVEKVSSVT